MEGVWGCFGVAGMVIKREGMRDVGVGVGLSGREERELNRGGRGWRWRGTGIC